MGKITRTSIFPPINGDREPVRKPLNSTEGSLRDFIRTVQRTQLASREEGFTVHPEESYVRIVQKPGVAGRLLQVQYGTKSLAKQYAEGGRELFFEERPIECIGFEVELDGLLLEQETIAESYAEILERQGIKVSYLGYVKEEPFEGRVEEDTVGPIGFGGVEAAWPQPEPFVVPNSPWQRRRSTVD